VEGTKQQRKSQRARITKRTCFDLQRRIGPYSRAKEVELAPAKEGRQKGKAVSQAAGEAG
jgi:hypothetical protein